MTTVRTSSRAWLAQRASAAVLAFCVAVHLGTMIVVVKGGLSGADILARTRGSLLWGAFYFTFVAAVAIHAPLGVRAVLAETLGGHRRGIDVAMLVLALIFAALGARAVLAVVVGAAP